MAHMHHQHQTLGEFDSLDVLFMNRNPICPSPPPGGEFEINPHLIALVKQYQFHGLTEDNPIDHIKTFEDIFSTTSSK